MTSRLELAGQLRLRDETQQGAFTLTELLVVIAIIGIAATLLLPVLLNGAKQRAQTVVCLNNLKQMGRALQMYAEENNDEVVYPNWGVKNKWQGWLFTSQGAGNLALINQALTLPAGQTGPLRNRQACPPMDLSAPNVQKYIYQANAFTPYLQNAESYWCPAENANQTWSQWYQDVFLSSPGAGTVSGNDIYSSYIMNGAVISFPSPDVQSSTLTQNKLSNINFKPNYVMMWEPDETINNAFGDGASPAIKGGGDPSQRHVLGSNVLRFDGGSEFQTYNHMTSQMNGFPNSPQNIATSTPFQNEFFYAPFYVDGGFNYGSEPTQP